MRLLSVCIIAIALLCGCGAISDPDAPSKETLDALLKKKAGRDEIAASLSGQYTWLAPGTEAWQGLIQFLGAGTWHAPVRDAVRKKQKIMYHTTMWQQTWIFLDDAERFESYWLTSQ